MARSKGEGTVYWRKDEKVWVAQWTVKTPRGPRRRTIRLPHCKKKRDALNALRDILGATEEKNSTGPTVERFLRDWLRDSIKPDVKPKTYESYERSVRLYIAPYMGYMPLADVRTTTVYAFYNDLRKAGKGDETIRWCHKTLSRALDHARMLGLIPSNPARERRLAPRQARPRVTVFTEDQAHRLLEAARGDRFYSLYVVALTTGLRRGELLGLDWSAVDLHRRTLRVERALVQTDGGLKLQDVKTNTSRRTIALPHTTAAALQDWRNSGISDNGLVWANLDGKPVNPSNLRNRHYKPLLKRAGLPDYPFHTLRHTAASIMLVRGVHPKLVQEILGHASIKLTLDTYSHFIRNMSGGAEAMDDFMLR